MLAFSIILVISVFVFTLLYMYLATKKRKSIIQIEEEKLRAQGWAFSQSYSNPQQGFIIVDETRQETACFSFPLIFFDETSRKTRIFKFEDILSCEILKDGETTYKKSTSRTVGGALLGGVLLGGAGAIVGGLSGNTKKNVKIKSLELKIVVRDLQDPNWIIPFYKEDSALLLTNATKEVNKWKDIFSIIIDRVDKSEKDKEDTKMIVQNSPIMSSGDIYEQLQKMADLKDKGILTEEEFIVQKAKILA